MFTSPGNNLTPNGMFGGVHTGLRAALYLFAPQRIRDHYKRSFLYHFHGGFQDELDTTLRHSFDRGGYNGMPGAGPIGGYNPDIDRLINSEAAKGIIVPNSQGTPILTSRLSDNWTFLMVVDNDGPQHRTESFSGVSALSNRTLYFGVCDQEPINPNNTGRGTIINDMACLIVTHKTTINSLPGFSSRGGSTRYDTMSDVDVIPGMYMGGMTADPLFRLTPEELRKYNMKGPDGSISTAIGAQADVRNSPSNSSITSIMNNPRLHGKKILNSIVRGFETTISDDLAGPMSEIPVGAIGWNDALEHQIDMSLLGTTNENLIGLPVHEPITMARIMREYNPEIEPIYINQVNQFDPVPQEWISAENVYSSLIAGAMPSVLSSLGLATLVFSYNSHNGNRQIYNVEPFTIMGEQELASRVKAAIDLIDRDIFSIVVANTGHIDVSVSCSCGGASHIQLNILDNNNPNEQIYEHNNMLGGINSQLLGTGAVVEHNNINLSSMISNVASR